MQDEPNERNTPPNSDDQSQTSAPNGDDKRPADNGVPDSELPTLVNAARVVLDTRVQSGETVERDDIMDVLTSNRPPEGDLLHQYGAQLLEYALTNRDAEAARLLAHLMDTNPDLDAALYPTLNDRLYVEPDLVYAFARARMAVEPSPQWQTRLQAAAFSSLQIAISDGDTETVGKWLQLIAREPTSYGLDAVLRGGLLAAGERARNDSDLALIVLTLAVKRDPGALELLLDDDTLLAGLPGNIGSVLRNYQGDALLVQRNQGTEMFTVALVRAARARAGALFTTSVIEQAWSLYLSEPDTNLPPQYQIHQVIYEITGGPVDWLPDRSLETLLALMLEERRDDLFLQLTRQMSDREDCPRLLVGAFQASGLSDANITALTEQLINSAELSAATAAELYVQLLSAREWQADDAPLVSKLARTLYQHPSIEVPASVLWHMLDIGSAAKDELVTRTSLRRLTTHLQTLDDDTILADALMRLYADTAWNAALRETLLGWWRTFARDTTLARLQRLDRNLDSKRVPDIRTIAQTVIALHKMQGKRSLSDFADAVNTTYTVLQAFSDSFEPSAKRPVSFDQETVREELDARIEELSLHERKILANNLKELAQLIAEMGDNRSKASLMRRGDDVDRQLMTGSLQPHSAVDALKWLAGYLSGSQDDDDET